MFNRNTLLAACAALVLTACGGGGGSDGTPSNEIPDPISPVDPGKPDPVPEPEPEPKPKPIRFNDTGISFCTDGINADNTVDCATTGLPRQDAHDGRDAAAAAGKQEKTGAGGKGFDFTKIANDGSELPATAELGPDPKNWACTRDNVTGLVWEVKVNDVTHLRHYEHTYVYNTEALGNTTCQNPDGLTCSVGNYVASVNSAKLCGASDWRVPSPYELQGVADLGSDTLPRVLDEAYFPNMPVGEDYAAAFESPTPLYLGAVLLTNLKVPNSLGGFYYQLNANGAIVQQTFHAPSALLLVRGGTSTQNP